MLDEEITFYHAEEERLKDQMAKQDMESEIINLFKELPKHRQKAILTELWSEIKPVKTFNNDMFKNLPF